MGMTRAIWVGQVRVWVGYGLPGLIARTASDNPRHYFPFIFTGPPTHGVGGRLVTVAGICRRLSSNRAQRRVTLSIRATPFRLRQTELWVLISYAGQLSLASFHELLLYVWAHAGQWTILFTSLISMVLRKTFLCLSFWLRTMRIFCLWFYAVDLDIR